jgi:hypothetical protein
VFHLNKQQQQQKTKVVLQQQDLMGLHLQGMEQQTQRRLWRQVVRAPLIFVLQRQLHTKVVTMLLLLLLLVPAQQGLLPVLNQWIQQEMLLMLHVMFLLVLLASRVPPALLLLQAQKQMLWLGWMWWERIRCSRESLLTSCSCAAALPALKLH